MEKKACLSHYFPWSTWFSILQVSGHHIGMETWIRPCFPHTCCFLSVFLSPNGIRSPSFCPGPFLSSLLATVSLAPVAAQHPGEVVSSGFMAILCLSSQLKKQILIDALELPDSTRSATRGLPSTFDFSEQLCPFPSIVCKSCSHSCAQHWYVFLGCPAPWYLSGSLC